MQHQREHFVWFNEVKPSLKSGRTWQDLACTEVFSENSQVHLPCMVCRLGKNWNYIKENMILTVHSSYAIKFSIILLVFLSHIKTLCIKCICKYKCQWWMFWPSWSVYRQLQIQDSASTKQIHFASATMQSQTCSS